MITPWKELSDRFLEIVKKAGGPEKGSDGQLLVEFTNHGTIYVELGAYSIGFWSRHTTVGEFGTEEEAIRATKEMIDRAELEVQNEEEDEEAE